MTTSFKNIVQGMSVSINTMSLIALISITTCQYFGLGELNQHLLITKDVVGISGATRANATETLDAYTNNKAE